MKPIVIIGSGHGGLTTAREIRQLDKNVEIIIISKEQVCAYYKPNLSKALAMKKSVDQLVMKTADRLENDLDVITYSYTNVAHIDTKENELCVMGLEGEQKIGYSSLVLAMGASPNNLPIIGDAKDEIVTVNSLDDYVVFREKIKNNTRVLIIGAGFVGCELASDLVSSQYHVDIVDLSQWPMQRMVPKEIGDAIPSSFPNGSSKWHMNTSVVKVSKSDDAIDVELSNGKKVSVDVVVSAAGLSPNCDLAFESGIKVCGGIGVDEYLRTNIENVYAIGDCAEINGNYLPFISPATHSAKALAKTILGNSTKLQIPGLDVAIKISTCPIVVSPSLKKTGRWVTTGKEGNFISRFIADDGGILGFAISGLMITHKNTLAQECIAANSLKTL